MKVKQIEPCDVLSHMTTGKKICCVDFGDNRNLRDIDVYDLSEQTLKGILKALKIPDNLFFEEVKEEK